jgi:hypothetical protein
MQKSNYPVPLLSQGDLRVSPTALDVLGGSFDFGPLTIKYGVDLATESVDIDVDLIGVKVASLVLSAGNPSARLDFNVGLASVAGSLTADFDRGELDGDFLACFLSRCKKFQGAIFSWGSVTRDGSRSPGNVQKPQASRGGQGVGPKPLASTGSQVIDLTRDTDLYKECVLSDDIGVGDCVQLAGSKVGIQLSLAGDNTATVTWIATTKTSGAEILFGDTWHQGFVFETADGGALNPRVNMGGPTMHDNNKPYPVNQHAVISMTPDDFGQISRVRWSYEC